MTDDVMKDLVTKHDLTITQLVASVEHLVASQTETNKRLEEISKFLAKQVVFSTKLENMDRDLTDSFKRVHKRIDEIETTQKSDAGCGATKLLNRDMNQATKDMNRLIGICEEHRISIDSLQKSRDRMVSGTTIKWAIGLALPLFVMLTVYYTNSLNNVQREVVKISEHIKGIEK